MGTVSRLLVASLLLAGCASEPRPQAPSLPSPPVLPPPEPADSTLELDIEEVRRLEEAAEQPPPMDPLPEHDGVVELRFASGEAALSAESRDELDRLCAWLVQQDSPYYIDLQGHTDGTGDEDANLELAEHRAMVVREYLHRTHGIPLDRMGVVPFGSVAPVANDRTAEGRERNRRVVLVILSML
jgi:outer membrane protein OmpA-like peptidoglycan-associated protein